MALLCIRPASLAQESCLPPCCRFEVGRTQPPKAARPPGGRKRKKQPRESCAHLVGQADVWEEPLAPHSNLIYPAKGKKNTSREVQRSPGRPSQRMGRAACAAQPPGCPATPGGWGPRRWGCARRRAAARLHPRELPPGRQPGPVGHTQERN
jgi:hypothetical protein